MSFINTEVIAEELDSVQQMSTERLLTGWFSGMDGHVAYLVPAYPQLREAHSAFTQARYHIWPDDLTDETWGQMKEAAANLARVLRELGNIDIPICGHDRQDGKCQYGLSPDGTCPRQKLHAR